MAASDSSAGRLTKDLLRRRSMTWLLVFNPTQQAAFVCALTVRSKRRVCQWGPDLRAFRHFDKLNAGMLNDQVSTGHFGKLRMTCWPDISVAGGRAPACPRPELATPEPTPELVEGPAKGLRMVYGLHERGHFDKLNDHAWVCSINVIERRGGSGTTSFDLSC